MPLSYQYGPAALGITTGRNRRIETGIRDDDFDWETIQWLNRVLAVNGAIASGIDGARQINTVVAADKLIKGVKRSSFGQKLIAIYPFLGSNILGPFVPLRDSLNVGIATNTSFVDGDINQSRGLTGGTGKYFNTLIKPSQLGTSFNGGVGIWVNNLNTSFDAIFGCYDNSANSVRFGLDLRSTNEFFWWNWPGNGFYVATGVAAGNNHYYGQRSSATLRELYRNGTLVGSNTGNDTTAAASTTDPTMFVLGNQYSGGNVGNGSRAALAYMTDGTLSSTEVAQAHELFQVFFLTAYGRWP